MRRIKIRLVKVEQPLNQMNIILGQTVNAALFLSPAPPQAAGNGVVQVVMDKAGCPAGRIQVLSFAETQKAPGQGRQRQPIPGGQDFVVQVRPGATRISPTCSSEREKRAAVSATVRPQNSTLTPLKSPERSCRTLPSGSRP